MNTFFLQKKGEKSHAILSKSFGIVCLCVCVCLASERGVSIRGSHLIMVQFKTNKHSSLRRTTILHHNSLLFRLLYVQRTPYMLLYIGGSQQLNRKNMYISVCKCECDDQSRPQSTVKH